MEINKMSSTIKFKSKEYNLSKTAAASTNTSTTTMATTKAMIKQKKSSIMPSTKSTKSSRSLRKEIKEAIRDSMLSSTSHGIPNMIKAKYKLVKFIWTFFFIMSSCICSLLVYKSIVDYLKFEVVTRIRSIKESSAPFPTITICNTNPFLTEKSIEFLNEFYRQLNNITQNSHNNQSTSSSSSSSSSSKNNSDFTDNESDYEKKLKFINSHIVDNTEYDMALSFVESHFFSDERRKEMGYPIDKMLIKCNFVNEICNSSIFSWFYNYVSGNCFTFNSKIANGNDTTNNNNNVQIKEVTGPGLSYGLRLELFVGLADQYPTHYNTFGIKLIINNISTFPFNPTDNYIQVNVGTETNIAIRRTFINKLKKPYSDCDLDLNHDGIDSNDSELFKSIYTSNYKYSQTDCYFLCYQKYLIEKCFCYDLYFYKLIRENWNYFKTKNKNKLQPCLSIEQNKCLSDKNSEFIYLRESFCNSLCPTECNSISFSYSSSFNEFPTRMYAKQLTDSHEILKNYSKKFNLTYEKVKQSVLKLNIFYETLNYELITELPNTTLIGLFADIGGTLGLCVGISILSFIEIFEVLARVFMLLFKRNTTGYTSNES